MLLLIDNIDSFTYNIVSAFVALGEEIRVVAYDQVTAEDCLALDPCAIIIGPGPGHPTKSTLSHELVGSGVPILGICMGHQVIGACFGAKVALAAKVMHGKQSLVEHHHDPLFAEIPSPFLAMRYHSLILEEVREPLEVIAWAGDEVMAIKHQERPIVGVQFHPDSIGTPCGQQLFSNYLKSLHILKSVPR